MGRWIGPSDDRETQWLSFAPDADGFSEAVGVLCKSRIAVSLVTKDGRELGVILIAVSGGNTLIYERWDDDVDAPSGESGTMALETISGLRIY
jgi:hypothetical protein